jgi:hypothetical protein
MEQARGHSRQAPWLVGTVYNFCVTRRSLHLSSGAGVESGKSLDRGGMPARATGITNHRKADHKLLALLRSGDPTQERWELTEMVRIGCLCRLPTTSTTERGTILDLSPGH